MNESKTQSMYEAIPAVTNLNQVPGFNPFKFLRRTFTENNEPVLQLDLRYKKLWFRLANPHGRIRLINLHITEQLAIIEAKVFFNRNDTEPISSFTARCTIEENEKYIEAAQDKALNEALSNAGFGLQFADISAGTNGEHYGSIIPLMEQPVTQTDAKELLPADIQKNIPEPQTLPTIAASDSRKTPTKEEAEHLPVEATASASHITVLDGGQETKSLSSADSTKEALILMSGCTKAEAASPKEPDPTPIKTASPPAYTADMSVEQIIGLMTFEEASQVLVDIGTCNGWTMAQVAERRAPSLRWYVFGYRGDNNILRAAAQIMLDSLDAQKAS